MKRRRGRLRANYMTSGRGAIIGPLYSTLRATSLIVSVIGAGAANGETIALAERVGRELAERGAVVVCGGLGGVMEAVCRGAKSAGGATIGILPGFCPETTPPTRTGGWTSRSAREWGTPGTSSS